MTMYLVLISLILLVGGLEMFGVKPFTLAQAIRFLIVVPVLRMTGYRFSKWHRHNESLAYRLFNTTLANLQADRWV